MVSLLEIRRRQAMTKIGAAVRVIFSGRGIWRCHTLLSITGLILALAPQAQAGFIGYYDLNNWTVTNTDNGKFPSLTNGSVSSLAGGISIELTGGNSGSGLPGTTDVVINATGGGLVQFRFSYQSADIPAADNPGCGPLLDGPCDFGGILFNGTFNSIADDVHQTSGIAMSFAVNPGDTFGFRVETLDNFGKPGILTISEFSAPVPEPVTVPLLLLSITLMAGANLFARRKYQAHR